MENNQNLKYIVQIQIPGTIHKIYLITKTLMSAQLHKAQDSFSLKNLEPIEYLKTFNRILENIQEKSSNVAPVPLVQKKSKQLKTVNLSKFPLPEFYYQMEGIFEANNKKNQQTERLSKKNIEMQKYEKDFMKNHYKFMKSTIQTIIEDNESQQKNLSKYKQIYRKNTLQSTLPLVVESARTIKRFRSEGKFNKQPNKSGDGSNDQEKGLKRNSSQNIKNRNQVVKSQNQPLSLASSDNLNNIKSARDAPNKYYAQNGEQESNNPIFKKMRPPKKLGKYHVRKQSEIEKILHIKSARQPSSQNCLTFQLSKNPLMSLTQRRQNSLFGKEKHLSIKQNKIQPELNHLAGASKTLLASKIQEEKIFENESSKDPEESEDIIQFKEFRSQIKLPIERDPVTKQAVKKQHGEDILKELAKLQQRQTQIQRHYAQKIDSKIESVHLQLNERIREVKRFKY